MPPTRGRNIVTTMQNTSQLITLLFDRRDAIRLHPLSYLSVVKNLLCLFVHRSLKIQQNEGLNCKCGLPISSRAGVRKRASRCDRLNGEIGKAGENRYCKIHTSRRRRLRPHSRRLFGLQARLREGRQQSDGSCDGAGGTKTFF